MVVTTLTSVVAIAWAGVAYAQTNPNGNASQPPVASAAALPSQSAIDTEEIIVTAQRRDERLVDVPISVTAISPAQLQLAGPESLENLTKAIPGVYMQRAVYGLSPTIRGVGSTLGGNVAVYVDGVARPIESGNIFDLASVSGLEVLKGPQGTLFGVNATGGALLISTLDPDFNRAGRFNVSFERFNQVRSSAYLNVPINDMIAINGAVAYRYSPGYIRDLKTDALVNQGRNFTARGKLLIQPAENFSAIFTAAHSDFDDPTGSSYQATGVARALLLPGVDSGPIARDRFHNSHNIKEIIQTSTDEFSAHFKLDLDFGTITAISAYQVNDLYSVNDLDATYATIPAPIVLPPPLPPITVGVIPTNGVVEQRVHSKTFTQEVNLASKDSGSFSYVAGFFYLHNESAVPLLRSSGVPLFNAVGSGETYAGYAEGTYKLSDFSIFAGIRYTHETQIGKSANGVDAPSPFTRIQRATENKWTPRVGVRYALSPDSNIYATYSKGVKSGRFDLTSPNGPAVKPEELDAFEIGFKTSSRMFTLNAAAFYYDYRDFQVSTVISGGGGAILTQYFNVPRSEIYGIDIDAMVRFSDAFDIRLGGAYTHSRYTDFKSAPGYTDDPAVPSTAFGLINAGVPVNASGNQMIRAPEFTASATAAYHADLGDDRRLDLMVSPYYSGRVYFDFANQLSQKPYLTLDAAATLTLSKHINISVYGRNLTDEVYFTNASTNTYFTGVNFGTPRTYGVSLGFTF